MDIVFALAAAFATVPATPLPAQGSTLPNGLVIERLYDGESALPGTDGTIYVDGQIPVACGDGAVFRAGEDRPGQFDAWVYFATADGVEVLIDEETRIYGTTKTFDLVRDVRCAAPGHFYFLAREASEFSINLYEWRDGLVRLEQEASVTLDGFEFARFTELGVSGEAAVMLASLKSSSGSYGVVVKPFGGTPLLAAEPYQHLPGSPVPSRAYSWPLAQGPDAVIRALNNFSFGLYRWSEPLGIKRLADEETVIPGVGKLVGAGWNTVLDDGIAFSAGFERSGDLGVGIFMVGPGDAVLPWVLPGAVTEEGETLTRAGDPRGNGDVMVFYGTTEEHPDEALFVRRPDGKITRLFGWGDMLDGRRIYQVSADADSHQIALRVDSADGMGPFSTIYRIPLAPIAVTDVPTLSPLATGILAGLIFVKGLLMLWRRRALI